jgi:hypothetical protein
MTSNINNANYYYSQLANYQRDRDFIDEKDGDLVEHCTIPEEVSSSESEEVSSSNEINNDHLLKRKFEDEEILNYFPKKIKNFDKESVEVSPIVQKLLDECTINNDSPGKKLLEDGANSMISQAQFNTLDL